MTFSRCPGSLWHRVVHVFVEPVEKCDIVDDDDDEDQYDFESDEEIV